jgi:hypothetical protein
MIIKANLKRTVEEPKEAANGKEECQYARESIKEESSVSFVKIRNKGGYIF